MHRGIRLSALANRGNKFAILQFDSVHGHIDLRDIDFFLFPIKEVIVAGDIGSRIADIAEKGAEWAFIIERQ